MAQVSRRFMDLIRNSSTLQYRCELFSAGLIDNPCHPCYLTERRRLCKAYVDRWTGTTTKVMKNVCEVLVERPILGWNCIKTLVGDLLTLYKYSESNCLNFIRVPPAASQQPVEMWSIPPFPFKVLDFTAHAPDNLLAVAERRGQ